MLDVAAQPNNALCDRFYTPEQDGLAQPWDGVVWCNPLYTGTGVLARWVQKAHESAQAGATTVCLLPVSTSAQWWQTYIRPLPLADVWMLPRRLKFGGAKNNAWFSSAVVIFRPPCQKES